MSADTTRATGVMLLVDSIAVQDVLFPVFPKEITHVWGSDGLRLQNTHYTSLDNGWPRGLVTSDIGISTHGLELLL
jgi:hypothetical protein